ncbi:MAG: IgGFc-binding protein [Deltaproteobacteria bacterium]|nr:IgGFc-binding protein [Deltaproteobacteria bacterium]
MRTSLTMAWVGILAAAALGCSPGADDTGETTGRDDGGGDGETGADAEGDGSDVPEVVVCSPGMIQCERGDAYTCNATGDGWESFEDCAEPTAVCVPEVGCRVCRPGETSCTDGMHARFCDGDGMAWVTDDCDPDRGETCVSGECTDLSPACIEARLANSYEGCDYWATQTINSQLRTDFLDSFHYAFVVGNRQDAAAHVEVQGPTSVLAEVTVAPSSTQVIRLDWNEAIRKPAVGTLPPLAYHSDLFHGAAYRVKSDVPVTVYQFNPLEYWPVPMIGSYSNDASLLLPKHVLTGNYMVASRPTLMWRQNQTAPDPDVYTYSGTPGFLAVIGVEDDTDLTVTFKADTTAGTTGSGIDAYTAGETATFHVDKYDVLQILSVVPAECTVVREELHPTSPPPPNEVMAGYCDMGRDYDLTGTLIEATKPIAVFSGHDCSFVPYDRWACDHLEEQMFPLEAWSTNYLATRPDPVGDEPSVWRVISREDGNHVTFMPDAWAPRDLDRGEFVEFASPVDATSPDDFEVEGTEPLLVVQFLYGQGSVWDSIGDPSMSLAVPTEQYRTAYNFLAPDDFREDPGIGQHGENWVNVTAPDGASVLLDGSAVTGFTPIGDTGFGVARVPILGGSHAITSTVEFGITCYGYGNYTSYMVPGGLDVDPISPFL